MPLTLSSKTNQLKLFRKKAWPYQQTFQIPLHDLETLAAAIASTADPTHGASVTFDEIVFDASNLECLLAEHSISTPAMDSTQYLCDRPLTVTGADDI